MATIGVIKEAAPGEQRVAMTPEGTARLVHSGLKVLVETGAGERARYPDAAYVEAGAAIVSTADLYAHADILVCVSAPGGEPRPGQLVLGLLEPLTRPALMASWARQGVTAVSLDLLPRTLSRAQPLDALTSQASVTGYKAVLVAANTYVGYFPMLITAAGTVKPATVLVLGAGVAGLQAIGTARRLGAVVSGYDVRPEARAEVLSVGARFLELGGAVEALGAGGYARELTASERQDQQHALDERIPAFDVVITTAAVPGRRPPLLVTKAALTGMRAGSVVVDTAAGPLGGNVALSRPGMTVIVPPGVLVVGAGNLPSTMPAAASAAYARNVQAALALLMPEGEPHLDMGDELQAAMVVCRDGELRNDAVRALLDREEERP
jgi:NAD(P) transhydrogenase subunit alpha